jgi:hypothetical protein
VRGHGISLNDNPSPYDPSAPDARRERTPRRASLLILMHPRRIIAGSISATPARSRGNVCFSVSRSRQPIFIYLPEKGCRAERHRQPLKIQRGGECSAKRRCRSRLARDESRATTTESRLQGRSFSFSRFDDALYSRGVLRRIASSSSFPLSHRGSERVPTCLEEGSHARVSNISSRVAPHLRARLSRTAILTSRWRTIPRIGSSMQR